MAAAVVLAVVVLPSVSRKRETVFHEGRTETQPATSSLNVRMTA
jgi:hypothetical protein